MKPQYVSWDKDIDVEHVNQDNFIKTLEKLKAAGYTHINFSTRVVEYTQNHHYTLAYTLDKYLTLYYYDDRGFHRLNTHARDDKKNLAPNAGNDAFRAVSSLFKERTGRTITQAFGTTDEEFKVCVPKQFYFVNDMLTNQTLIMSACDFCSQYPSMLCGLLPDSKGMKRVKGTVKPNKDYPFAFYLKSGHCAQYEVFDTHDWEYSRFRNQLRGVKEYDNPPTPDCKSEDDETILMKESKYSLTEEMEYFYSKRKTDPISKTVMNAFIGFFHKRNYRSNKQAHLAAIVIARANDRMMLLAEKIGYEKVVHIAVDGIIYLGREQYGVQEKQLGLLNQEITGAKCCVKGANTYVFEQLGRAIKFKHGSFDSRKDGIDIETCYCIKDMNQWCRAPSGTRVQIEKLRAEAQVK